MRDILTHRGPDEAGLWSDDRALLAVPATEYARVLVGRDPNRAGKITCPFHDDREPSLQLYEDGKVKPVEPQPGAAPLSMEQAVICFAKAGSFDASSARHWQ